MAGLLSTVGSTQTFELHIRYGLLSRSTALSSRALPLKPRGSFRDDFTLGQGNDCKLIDTESSSLQGEKTPSLSSPAPAAKSVRERLLRKLTSLEIAPGDRLTVDGIARELEVSQTPVREALSRLMGEGLVEKHHLRGFRATRTLSADELRKLFVVRILLEQASAEAAATQATAGQIAHLKTLHQSMIAADAAHDAMLFAQLDAEFHDFLAEASGNPFLKESLNRLHFHLHLFRVRSDRDVTGEALCEHKFLINAVDRQDSVIAKAAMKSHIQRSWDRLAAVLYKDSESQPYDLIVRRDNEDD